MLVIRDIQTSKLKEFNEALKKKKDWGEDAVALRGEIGSELHIFIWNQKEMMDCYYVDVVIMQNPNTSR